MDTPLPVDSLRNLLDDLARISAQWVAADFLRWFARACEALGHALGEQHEITKNMCVLGAAAARSIEPDSCLSPIDEKHILSAGHLMHSAVAELELGKTEAPSSPNPDGEPYLALQALPRWLEKGEGSRISEWAARDWQVPVILQEHLGLDGEGSTDDEFDSVMLWFFRAAKEVVFGLTEEDEYFLCPIGWVLNPDTGMQALLPLIRFTTAHASTIRMWLWLTMMAEAPIVPETRQLMPRLEVLYGQLREEGVEVQAAGGHSIRVGISRDFFRDPLAADGHVRGIVQPFELSHVVRRLLQEQEKSAQAKAVIARIDKALAELSSLLEEERRNEHDLQRCLTANPILFGIEYGRVIPKHRLGSDYEADYALELVDGSVDVVEIEASTHVLYTKTGNPSAPLVHAEQQVQDWLAWLDMNSDYARSKLPGVRRARGIVIIGRRSTLKRNDKERLVWRNSMYGGRLTILTFDDLVERCVALRSLLVEGASKENDVQGGLI